MNLQLFLRLGLKLKKVHRVLSFRQSNFLKTYIDTCTRLRKKSKTDFGKNLWKLFANAVFGKFIESTRNYLNVTICFDLKKCKKLISSPHFSNMKIISEDLVLIFSKQPSATLNKPYAVGFSILEKAKYFMYQQYYDVIKPNLENCEVLLSDTDSFLIAAYSYKEEDNLDKIKHILDYSNYAKDHPKFSTIHENKLGFFKDELKGNKMTQVCGIRAKSYCTETYDTLRKIKSYQTKCKGVTAAARRDMRFKNYKNCIKTIAKFRVNQHHIRSRNHRLQTIAVNKVAFSSFDDKRFLMECSVHSMPYGDVRIEESKNICPMCKIFNPLK
jgi:hypothetical protein